MMESAVEKSVSLLSSEDEVENENMPKIVSAVSLQGCSSDLFINETENSVENRDYESTNDKDDCRFDSSTNCKKEKRRIELKTLNNTREIKPSTSKKVSSSHVVDQNRLALQESMFKTKELFDTFLRVCQDQENSTAMETVVQKLMQAYDRAKQEYLGSVAFQNMLESETEKVNVSINKPWLNLKLVMDELKHNKKYTAPKLKLGESEDSQQDAGVAGSDDEPVIECPRKRKHLKKLEKTLRALNLRIKTLEEREVNWDEDDNSAYMKLDRYRDQFVKIYKKVCEIKGKLADGDRPYLRKVAFAGTTYPHINRCIERFYNKHREFPDFQDIKKLVVMANEQENIQMAPIKVHQMAMNAFKEFGEMLKRLRQYDDYDVMISYLDQQVDPARDNEALQEELNRNALLFKKKEQEVIDRFAEKSVGFPSEDENNSEDSKHKKKKRKIIFSSAKRKEWATNVGNNNLSSSESSDEEKEDERVTPPKNKAPSCTLDSSEDGNSEPETENKNFSDKHTRKVVGKGKALIGKARLVKRGVPKNSPKKISAKPNTTMTSDEDIAPKDSKDELTDYLGLQGNTPRKLSTKPKATITSDEDSAPNDIKDGLTAYLGSHGNSLKKKPNTTITSDEDSDSNGSRGNNKPEEKEIKVKTKVKEESDDEIQCIKEIKTSPKDNLPKTGIYSNNNTKGEAHLKNKSQINQNKHPTLKKDNSSNKKPLPIIRKVLNSKTATKSELTVSNKRKNRCSDSESDESRTSGLEEESEASEKKKSLSEVELSATELSSLSESEEKADPAEKENKLSSVPDNSVIVLSEDVTEPVNHKTNKKLPTASSQDSSDSDDICVLSQESSVTSKLAPKRSFMGNVKGSASLSYNPRMASPLNRNGTGNPARRGPAAHSTPAKRVCRPNQALSVIRKRPLNHTNSGSDLDSRKKNLPVVNNPINKYRNIQLSVPKFFNGASHKATITQIRQDNKLQKSPNVIPLIEID